jgi:integrase/recombinase XerD
MLSTIERVDQTQAIAIAQSTEEMIRLWLHGKSANTIKSYRRDIYEFLTYAGGVELNQITLNQLQGFETALGELGKSQNTIARKLAAVKSLLTFCQKVGLAPYNAGSMINVKPSKDTLSERILSRGEVLDMVYQTAYKRDRLLLKLLYVTGARVGELCQLTWSDIKPNEDGGARITLFGKGDKTRVILIAGDLYQELLQLKGEENGAVFRSRKGQTAITTTQAYRIVRDAADRVGITGNVSPHWLRHSHASHALDNNAPIHTVQKSLGHSSITTTERYLHSNPKDSSGLYIQV